MRALKLVDRGLLKPGHRADIAIFDPADFDERATYADPHQYPSGLRTTVIVLRASSNACCIRSTAFAV